MAPISRAFSLRASKSDPVAPDTAFTFDIPESKSEAVFTAATPRPATARDTGIIFFLHFLYFALCFAIFLQ
ncbi:hypothetical protein [Peptoniphilus porci]|uniref:hypothetical protein n=1 Tax=Peptoniphilus porci TaxID=2652280 RepID=UPI001F324E9D|nr:hypothetical protein [Peptoniphilus porci]